MLADLRGPDLATQSERAFSVIIDEITDISTTKMLAVATKYYSEQLQSAQTKFLCMIDLQGETAQDLFDCLNKALADRNLSLSNLIGFAADTTKVQTSCLAKGTV